MVYLVNYANIDYKESQLKNSETGLNIGGIDKVFSFSPKDLSKDFKLENKKILKQTRGNGYWLWKPYVISEVLNKLAYGDFLFYCDSGAYFLDSVRSLVQRSIEDKQDIVCFNLLTTEKEYTKRDTLVSLDCDSPEFYSSPQRLASFFLIKKSEKTERFIADYLHFCKDYHLLSDEESVHDEYGEFKTHRHDQSIFSLLTKKYGFTAYRDPSQFGNSSIEKYENSPYQQLIEHTRKSHVTKPLRWWRKIKKKVNKLSSLIFYRYK